MNLNENLRREAIQCFYRGKRQDFNLQATLDELRQACHANPTLLQTFLEIQAEMAAADGHMTQEKRDALLDICRRLGVQMNFGHYQQQYSGQHYQSRQYQTRDPLTQDYTLLEINDQATAAEIKKAYRRMMSKYHPDRLMAKGVPQEMITIATQKTQQIKAAYERIRSAKKF